METSKEIWRDCTGKWFGFYEVSNLGRVRNKAIGMGRVMGKVISNKAKDNKGYPQVYLYKNSKQHTTKVHRLVMTAFVGERNGLQVDHVNGDKSDNRLVNLEYVTAKENNRRSRALGLQGRNYSKQKPKGKKINYQDAKDIRGMISIGIDRSIIAELYGIHRMTVGEIYRKEIWKEETHEK